MAEDEYEWANAINGLNDALEEAQDSGVTKEEALGAVENVYGK